MDKFVIYWENDAMEGHVKVLRGVRSVIHAVTPRNPRPLSPIPSR